VECASHRELGITEDQWVLLIDTLGNILDIQHLEFDGVPGSRNFRPFQAFADAVNNAHSLREVVISLDGETFPRDSSGLTALANALREHTALEKFIFFEWCPLLEVAQSTALDPLILALSACPHLQDVFVMAKFASSDAVKKLLQLGAGHSIAFSTDT
jgi:hypothetical protein